MSSTSNASSNFLEKIEILPGRLYFCTVPHKSPAVDETGQPSYAIRGKSNQFIYFCTDASLTYTAFFADFGPLNIGLTFNFCEQLDAHLAQSKVDSRPVIYYCSQHPHYRANSAVLLLAYLIFVQGMTVEQAYAPFIGISPRLISSRDAAFCINSYPIFPLDCAKAFYRASHLNHFDYATFDVHKHDQLAKLENGDVSWIVPGKFIAFSGPMAQQREVGPGLYALSPEAYVPLFHSLGVTCVVRFNKKAYDRNIFTRGGIRHVDLFYEDGGNPSDEILQAFLRTCEQETGAIAVHCKAGLGRTGTNIAAYMMKHYGYTAREASAWCRVCRPGSVVGPQQQYLETKQDQLWGEGRLYRQAGKGVRAPARLSAGRQRPVQPQASFSLASSAGGRKKRPHKSFDTIEESVTARLLARIVQEQQEVDAIGSQASSSNDKGDGTLWEGSRGSGGSSPAEQLSLPPRSMPSKMQRGDQRPSTSENGRKSAERMKNEFESTSTSADRKNSRGSVGTSVSAGGSTGHSHGGSSADSRGTVGRAVMTEQRRPNTSGGVVPRGLLSKTATTGASGSSSGLRSGGGLRGLSSAQSPHTHHASSGSSGSGSGSGSGSRAGSSGRSAGGSRAGKRLV